MGAGLHEPHQWSQAWPCSSWPHFLQVSAQMSPLRKLSPDHVYKIANHSPTFQNFTSSDSPFLDRPYHCLVDGNLLMKWPVHLLSVSPAIMFALLRKGVRGVHCYISWVNKPRHMAGAPEAPAQYMNEWLLSCTMTTTGCKCAFQEFQERVSLCELGPGYTAYILKRNNFMTAFFKVCAEFSKVTEKALVEVTPLGGKWLGLSLMDVLGIRGLYSRLKGYFKKKEEALSSLGGIWGFSLMAQEKREGPDASEEEKEHLKTWEDMRETLRLGHPHPTCRAWENWFAWSRESGSFNKSSNGIVIQGHLILECLIWYMQFITEIYYINLYACFL